MSDLLKLIKSAIQDYEWHTRTCIPAKILSVDYAKQECEVQVLVQSKSLTGQVISIAPLVGVPLLNLSSGTGQFSNPVPEGTTGLLLICDRSIDSYMYSSGDSPIDPEDRRSHDLSDAVFIPGLYPYSQALGTNPRLTVMRHNAGVNNKQNPGEHAIHLHPTGDAEGVVIQANRFSTELASIKVNQDGSIKLTSDEGNSAISEISMNADGSVNIDANDGTNIALSQGGNVTVNSPAAVVVNSATADVNCTGNVTVDGAEVHLNGTSGGGVVTSTSINHATGIPHGDSSGTVKADY